MTAYGLNPSFCDPWSTLPLFSNLLRRGHKINDDGSITIGAFPDAAPDDTCVLDIAPSGMVRARSRSGFGPIQQLTSRVTLPGSGMEWHRPSLAALATFKPQVLRTLDWQRTNERTDWSQPRVAEGDLLQGTKRGMAIELQCRAANLLGSHLWWCAPPRYELAVAEYEQRLEEMLRAIKDTADKPPILEYGNELWNAGFPIHGWLKDEADRRDPAGGLVWKWQDIAAQEIAILKRVADRVFGTGGLLGQRPYYLFVGGQLTVPSHLDRILSSLVDLGIVPDAAGPALYVTPLKASMEEWARTGSIPTQDELRSSCERRLIQIAMNERYADGGVGPLQQHRDIREEYRVPYFGLYEAGQSLIARTPQGPLPWRKAALEAQRSDWLGDLYREIRRVAEAAGVDLLCWYSAATDQEPTDPRLDVFGLLESTDLSKMLPKALAARGD